MSVAGPSQVLPPSTGDGLLHSRVLVLVPVLHGLLQFGQEVQLPQLPSTTQQINSRRIDVAP